MGRDAEEPSKRRSHVVWVWVFTRGYTQTAPLFLRKRVSSRVAPAPLVHALGAHPVHGPAERPVRRARREPKLAVHRLAALARGADESGALCKSLESETVDVDSRQIS